MFNHYSEGLSEHSPFLEPTYILYANKRWAVNYIPNSKDICCMRASLVPI